jgi:hypothetical protein
MVRKDGEDRWLWNKMIKEKGRYNVTYQHQGMNSWMGASYKVESTCLTNIMCEYFLVNN